MRERRRATAGLGRRDGALPGESAIAVLLVASERNKQWVACACERAEAKGVREGMNLAHAKALLKGMHVWERPFTPAEDTERLHRLARWTCRFSPTVAPDEPDGLLLDMSGCEHLFGGNEQMVAAVDTSFARLGLSARLAMAPTIGCAWAVARFGVERVSIVAHERIREELAPLPIAGLRIDARFVAALHEVGIERIGSLFDLPREELACRFGADVLRRLDQATGTTSETITPLRPSTPIETTRTFDGPVTSLEAIVRTAHELLFALVLELEQRECGVRTLEIVLERIATEPSRTSIALTYPSRDVRHLWTLLRPKIERVDFGYGVESVLLRASRFGKRLPEQACFSHTGPGNHPSNEAVLGEFLDRLMDRLGTQAVRRAVAVETHVPEEAFPLRAWSGPKGARKEASGTNRIRSKRTHANDSAAASHLQGDQCAADGTACIHRPSTLLEIPEPVRVISLLPEGPPSWLYWRGRECAVRSASGPERLALPWWEGKRVASPLPDKVRDYYEVQDDQGRLLWVFRDQAHGWFVHGLWA